MVKQKALFTDFDAVKEKVRAYQYFDGENMPNDVAYEPTRPSSGTGKVFDWRNGTPTPVAGVVGRGNKFSGESLYWHNWKYPQINKASISMWVKFAPADLDGWSILATNRGDGFPTDRGFHIATYNKDVNLRMYSAGGSLSEYSTNQLEANKWYHISLIYDGSWATVMVNGEEWIRTFVAFSMPAYERSLLVGDMDGGYGMQGTIMDEFIFAINDDAWTIAESNAYYKRILNGEELDNQSVQGSLRLAKGIDGTYPTNTPVSWTSPTIDLGGIGQFVDFGYIEAVGQLPSDATSLSFYTRSSSDKVTWDDWLPLAGDGKIQSENVRYLEVRVDFETSDGAQSPQLDEIRIMEDLFPIPVPDLPNTQVTAKDPLILYFDKDSGLQSLGEMKNAYDIVIDEEINGEDTLKFKLPIQDVKRKNLGKEPVETIAVIGERYYVIKETIDKRDSRGKPYSEFIAEALWTELRDWYVDGIEVVEVTARTALQTIVDTVFREKDDPEFEWTVGRVDIERRRTLRAEWTDVLSLVRSVANTWGGEVIFDTKDKVIHLVEMIGEDTGVRFQYEKNLKDVERIVNTYDLITRIYPTGKNGLDITSVNNGVNYLENRKWVDKLGLRRKIIPYKWSDERYTVVDSLKEDAQIMLDELAKPNVSYISSVLDLSSLSGHEHEAFNLGDIIYVSDGDLFDEEIGNRVMRRSQDVRKPENTTVELSQPVKTLADIRSRAVDEQIESLISSDPLSTSDVQQMTVFNTLLNSRGDDGFNSWVHTPNGTNFELANVGFSGSWSYKVTPDFDVDAQLTQTVEGVAHRSAYTVSASVSTEGEIIRGGAEDAFIGIKVLVYYEGESEPEVHYLGIPDITSEGG